MEQIEFGVRLLSSSQRMPNRYYGAVEAFQPDPLTRRQRTIALAIVAVYLCVTLSLALTARPDPDEAAYANPGYNLAFNGHMGITIFELRGYMPLSSAQRTYWQPPLYFLVTAALFRILGFGLLQVRFLSIFFGLVCLISWHTIVRSLTKSALAALAAMALISVDYFFLISASHGRMEMMCVGLGSAGVAVYMRLRQTNLPYAVLWGNAFAALAMITHPVGMVWAAGVFVGMLLLDRRVLTIKAWVLGMVPYVLAGGAWVTYIVQDVQAYRDQMATMLAMLDNIFYDPHLSHFRPLRYLELEVIHRYASPYGLLPGVGAASRLKILVLVSYLTAGFGILFLKKIRQQPGLIWFPLTFIAAFLIFAESSPSKFAYYLPHTTVMLAACLGVFITQVSKVNPWRSVCAAIAILGGVQLAGATHLVGKNEYHRLFLPAAEAAARNSPPYSLIMASNEMWFGVWRDHQVLNDHNLGLLSGLRPDLFVMDQGYRDLHEIDRRQNPVAYEYVQDLLNHSRVVFDNSYYRVYLRGESTAAASSRR